MLCIIPLFCSITTMAFIWGLLFCRYSGNPGKGSRYSAIGILMCHTWGCDPFVFRFLACWCFANRVGLVDGHQCIGSVGLCHSCKSVVFLGALVCRAIRLIAGGRTCPCDLCYCEPGCCGDLPGTLVAHKTNSQTMDFCDAPFLKRPGKECNGTLVALTVVVCHVCLTSISFRRSMVSIVNFFGHSLFIFLVLSFVAWVLPGVSCHLSGEFQKTACRASLEFFPKEKQASCWRKHGYEASLGTQKNRRWLLLVINVIFLVSHCPVFDCCNPNVESTFGTCDILRDSFASHQTRKSFADSSMFLGQAGPRLHRVAGYCAIRIGEADHPGPSHRRPSPNQLHLGIVNPTTVVTKVPSFLDLFQKVGAHIVTLSETAATAHVQHKVAKQLSKHRVLSIWSPPAPPQRDAVSDRLFDRGKPTGTAVLSRVSCRPSRLPMEPPWSVNPRFVHSIVQLGQSHFQLIVVYGYSHSKCNPQATSQTDELLRFVLHQVEKIPLPFVICGDFNLEPSSLPCWHLFQRKRSCGFASYSSKCLSFPYAAYLQSGYQTRFGHFF